MKITGIDEKRLVLYFIAMLLAMVTVLPKASEAQLDKLHICGKRS